MGNDPWKHTNDANESRRDYESEYRKRILMAGKKTKSRTLTRTITRVSGRAPVKQIVGSALPSKYEPSEAILLTGGIGDVITLESWFPQSLKSNVQTIFYASIKNTHLRRMMSALTFPKLRSHIAVWNDFEKFWCFVSKRHVIEKIQRKNQAVIPDLMKAQDWSINDKFPKFRMGHFEFQGSSLLKTNLAATTSLQLPQTFAVVCPYSNDKRSFGRDFNESDWNGTISQLKTWNMQGVVIYNGDDSNCPKVPELIDLSNKTTLFEAFEILKRAKGYIGVDSCLSVLAAQKFEVNRLVVKSINPHCLSWKDVYFAPKRDFSFIKDRI